MIALSPFSWEKRKMLSAKRLQKTISQLPHSDKELISRHFAYLWETYHSETEYHKTLLLNGKIAKRDYDKVAIPKLRAIRDELYQTARVLKAI